LLDCKTYRVEPHCGIIADTRPVEELKKWKKPGMDPLVKLCNTYPKIFTKDILTRLEKKVAEQVESAVKYARESAIPEISELIRNFGIS
jgi:TPP-dependent pyruvate/acetoin dehydrogenase alpha subunit